MSSAFAVLHLNMVYRFPRAFSWVPRRRRGQVSHEGAHVPHTLVLAKNAEAFQAWLERKIPPEEREGYAFLDSEDDLKGFLEDKLSKIEMPSEIEFRSELPKTIIGKLSKKELVAEETEKRGGNAA